MIIRKLAQALSPGAQRGRLAILIFHRVLPLPDPLFPELPDVRRFRAVLGWLRQWFQLLPLDEAVRLLGQGRLPARAAAITFDDGYADNATQALPVLRELGIPATFFVCSSFLDGGRMWNDTVIESLRRTRHLQIDLRAQGLGLLPLHTLGQRRAAIDRLLAGIKYRVPQQRLLVVEQLVQEAGALLPRQLMLRTEQLLALRDGGMRIGAHSVSHPILAHCTDPEARWEIAHSRQVLEDKLGEPVTLFAYPNGKPGRDYAARHVAMVREAGYVAAVSTAGGAAGAGADVLQLPRFTPWDQGYLRYGLRLVGNLRQPTELAD